MSIVSSGQLGNIQSKTNAQASINFKSQNTSVFSEQIYETIDYVTDVLEDFADVAGTALATGAVVVTTVVSGVAKVCEYIDDGIKWVKGTVISGVLDLFGFDDQADKVRESTMDFIARDRVGEMNEAFYENTTLGRAINEKSAMKYDSELAKTIQNITIKAVELTAAVALTVATGGLCAPLAAAVVIGVGSLEGIGKSAEERYQDPNRSYDTGAILLDGFGNGLNWYATGKLGQGGIQALSAIKEVGAKTAAKAVLGAFRNAWQYKGKILTKDFLKNILKSGLLDLDNLLDSFGIIGDNLAEWANGGEFDAKQMAKELALAYGLNCLMDGFTNLLFKAKTISMAEEQAKQLTKEVVDLTTDSSAIANDVNSDFNADANTKFDLIGDSSTFTYGVDQGACSKLIKTKRLNNDWLIDEVSFEEFMVNKFPDFSQKQLDEAIDILKNKDTISDFGKETIIEFLQLKTNNYEEAFELFNKSFEPFKSLDYDKLMKKYTDLGLSKEDVVYMFKGIDALGACSYAATANQIVGSFLDKPQLFKEYFGYDLYKIIDGKEVINSSELLSDLFVYANLDTNGGKLFSIVDDKLTIINKNFNDRVALSGYGFTRDDIFTGFLQSKNMNLKFSDEIMVYKTNDPNVHLGIDSSKIEIREIHDIIKSKIDSGNQVRMGVYKTDTNQFTFYNMDGTVHVTTNDWNEGGGHAIFVTEVMDDGIIVSSWGEKLKILLEDFNNNKFNISWGKISGIE